MNRGEIYLVDFDPVVGQEQYGKRPALIVSCDEINDLPLVVTIVPGTNGANVCSNLPWNVRVPSTESGLRIETVFLCFQAKASDKSRFSSSPIGKLSEGWKKKINEALAYTFAITS